MLLAGLSWRVTKLLEGFLFGWQTSIDTWWNNVVEKQVSSSKKFLSKVSSFADSHHCHYLLLLINNIVR